MNYLNFGKNLFLRSSAMNISMAKIKNEEIKEEEEKKEKGEKKEEENVNKKTGDTGLRKALDFLEQFNKQQNIKISEGATPPETSVAVSGEAIEEQAIGTTSEETKQKFEQINNDFADGKLSLNELREELDKLGILHQFNVSEVDGIVTVDYAVSNYFNQASCKKDLIPNYSNQNVSTSVEIISAETEEINPIGTIPEKTKQKFEQINNDFASGKLSVDMFKAALSELGTVHKFSVNEFLDTVTVDYGVNNYFDKVSCKKSLMPDNTEKSEPEVDRISHADIDIEPALTTQEKVRQPLLNLFLKSKNHNI